MITRGMGWGNVLDYMPKLVCGDMNRCLMKEVEEDEIKAMFQF